MHFFKKSSEVKKNSFDFNNSDTVIRYHRIIFVKTTLLFVLNWGNHLFLFLFSLCTVELRNSFNYFLVVLAFVDNTFIFITLLDYSFARGKYIEEGCIQKERQRSSPLFGVQNLLNSMPR